jgi:2-methylcitrate dehydratase PrpD
MANMKALLDYWDSHGTKVLGSTAAIVAALLAAPALLPAGGIVKALQIANIVLGVLTVKRGFTNSQEKPSA